MEITKKMPVKEIKIAYAADIHTTEYYGKDSNKQHVDYPEDKTL